MTDLMMVGTREGKLLFANHAVSQKLKYSGQELMTMSILDLHPSEKRHEAEIIFSQMLKGTRNSCPLPLETKFGELLPVETRIWLGKWNGIECIFGICKDLSAEMEAQQRFERLFQGNPALMALSSFPERIFMDVNQTFLFSLGYKRGSTWTKCE